jgi:hypothetical protein
MHRTSQRAYVVDYVMMPLSALHRSNHGRRAETKSIQCGWMRLDCSMISVGDCWNAIRDFGMGARQRDHADASLKTNDNSAPLRVIARKSH